MNTTPEPFLPLIGVRKTPAAYAGPVLKWAGGKRQVLQYLIPLLPEEWNDVHEPFVGGGAFFFEMAARRPKGGTWATLTDNNERLIRTYAGVRDHVDRVVELLQAHRNLHEKDYYYEVRAHEVDDQDDATLAAWMIYLNKTGFNGLYRVNSKNKFNVPFGSYVNPTVCDERNLRAASRVLQGARLQTGDFDQVLGQAKEGDLVYFDPPYVPLTDTAYFTAYTKEGFGGADQARLRDVAVELKRRGVHVILSNHDTSHIRELYADGFEIQRVMIGRAINSAGDKRGKVAEVIIT